MSEFISAKEFGTLKRQDLDNGAFIDDIWRALKNREELEARLETVKLLSDDLRFMAARFQDSAHLDKVWIDRSERLMNCADKIDKALEQK